MAQVTHGMNPEEVDALAVELQRMGDDLDRIARVLGQKVGTTSWVGPEAARFKGQWWPTHRSHLSQAAGDLRGFGTSAKNNATEQRQASGGGTGAGAAGGVGIGAGAIGAGPGSVAPPPPGTVNGFPGWGKPIDDAQAKAIADRFIPPGERPSYDFNGAKDGAGDWYQCTAWAKARWRQMGWDLNARGDWSGNGGDVAHNINAMLGRPDSHEPTVGAIMSRPGHVAVVEEVRALPNGQVQFRVSEMNMGADFNNGRAEEFQISDWTDVSASQTFAAFPG